MAPVQPNAGKLLPRFKLSTELKLDPGWRSAFRKMAQDAYTFDASEFGWSPSDRLSAGAVTFTILQKLPGNDAGRATDANHVNIDANFLNDAGLLAHELAHVQDFREGGVSEPAFLREGRAALSQLRYLDQLGTGDPKALSAKAHRLGELTPETVKAALAGNAEADPHPTGLLFMLFLRTRLRVGDQRGFADTQRRLAAFVESMNGLLRKQTPDFDARLEPLFQAQFGVTLSDAKAQFIDYVGRTNGDPSRRLAGTMLAKYL